MDYPELRQALVDCLKDNGSLYSPKVTEALLKVPRHCFVEASPEEAYEDKAISLKKQNDEVVSTISQPSIVAHMLEELQLEAGNKVLEVGAGSGYNAALISYLVGPEGQVITMEYDKDMAERAKANLKDYPNVEVICGDGRYGYEDRAPFTRIVATVTAIDVYLEWQRQLADGGLMLLPLEYVPGFTRLLKLQRKGNELQGRFNWAVNFVPMAGESLGKDPDLDELARLLRTTPLSQQQQDSLIFFCLCSGYKPRTALNQWVKLGSPKPDDFILRSGFGEFLLELPSITLGMSLSG